MTEVGELQLLNIVQVCETLGIARTSLRRLRMDRGFPRPLLVGRSKRWMATEIKKWMDEARRITR